jgi:hypothetical protein
MPLDKSGSKSSVGRNISKLVSEGLEQRQAIAIAESVKDRAIGVNHLKQKGKPR